MKTPPAPPEDLLFSPPSQEPAHARPTRPDQKPHPAPTRPAQHASSSDSGMSNERNADSVLFKLDTLTAMQAQSSTERSKEGGAPEAMARLAAPAPQSEAGSGLIDLSTLAGAPAHTEQAAEASNSGSDMTSSAALSQSSLLSNSGMSRVVPTPDAAASGAALAPAPSRTPLLILSVLAVLALVAAVTAIVLRG